MNFRDTYYSITGVAYTKGLDYFDDVMPKTRVLSLFNSLLETKGFKWVELNFINFVICTAGKDLNDFVSTSEDHECSVDCQYRMPYGAPGLQSNALRVEFFEPADRCGRMLKPGHIGGVPNDYLPCTFSINKDFPQPGPFENHEPIP